MTAPTARSDDGRRTDGAPGVLTMQQAILRLQQFWSGHGCMVMQPFNTEVGAGTANPATALRVLGPEPWQVGYVEPSVRPDDSRYGQNPNRLQTHTQFQVILKPDPGNPQELYLQSLTALGIDLEQHDVRFVEDNWASPALGAWGLGWEVWLNGMEITQFTYFQQAGGLALDPVSVEITYGLERILMNLQGVTHFADIRYADGVSYGEIFGQSEYEMSRYYLDDADIDSQRSLYRTHQDEAQRMLDLGLPVPAYTHILRCSHLFNVLDARGAISTTERAASFKAMRTLTRDTADLWTSRRSDLGHPLGVVEPLPTAVLPTERPAPSGPETLLFEIGVEELPAADVVGACETVRSILTAGLDGTRLEHGPITVDATPRRIIVEVAAVAPAEPEVTEFARGPKAAAAFDADGNPTKAALGFSRGQGVDAADLETVEVNGTAYVGITKTVIGRTAAEVLQQLLPEVVSGLRSSRNMRWSDPQLSYSRPIRWLLALLGDAWLPVTVSALLSGTSTRVLRTAAEPVVAVPSARGYTEFLAEHHIVAGRGRRRELITAGAVEVASGVGGRVDLDGEASLIDEITDLTENPQPILGSFAERYMELPDQVLTTVMRKHQRYLPVIDDQGSLLPYFVLAANGPCDADAVRAGNESVLRARYEDAAFFFDADLKVRPEEFRNRLDKLNFETRLGSMADRASRIAALADRLAEQLDVSSADRATVRRAGALAKFDLASQMVIELSSLAGVMAGEYALAAGESPEVAQALVEMERPRSAGDQLPASLPGAILALADRLDLLTGMIAIGNAPTGHSDPYGVRRAAIGIVNILRELPALGALPISGCIDAAADQLRGVVELPAEVSEDALAVATRRFELQLLEGGHQHDLVRAAMAKADLPSAADADLATLETHRDDAGFHRLTEAVQRIGRILGPAESEIGVAPAELSEPAEQRLDTVISGIESSFGDHGRIALSSFLEASTELPEAVDQFFDQVMVLDEDQAVRAARVALLRRMNVVAERVIDFHALAG